jgi:predicted Zn-dependent peptidase
VLDKNIANSVSTANGIPGARYPNLFIIEALPRPPHTADEVTAAIYKEIDRLKNELVTTHELQKIKNQLRATFIRGLASNDGLASQLSYFQIICNDWRYLEKHEAVIDTITAQDIQNVARRYLTASNRTVAELIKKPAHN